jgi:ribosomal small subunit protein bTHX
MGKGDKKSKKGKRFKHSFGKTRPRKKGRTLSSRKKVEQKPAEQKKQTKLESEFIKPATVVETKVQEISIKTPEVSEIKEKIKSVEVIETTVKEVPEVTPVPVIDEVKVPDMKEAVVSEVVSQPLMEPQKTEEPVFEAPEKVEHETEAKPEAETPRKRGRPKKKKEE